MEEKTPPTIQSSTSLKMSELKELKKKAKAYDDIMADQDISVEETELTVQTPTLKKEETKKEYEYICPKCEHQFDGKLDSCPKCGEQLEWD